MTKRYSTGEAAKKIGVSRQTLQTWIERELITAPELAKVGRISVRLWQDADLRRARRFKGTLKPGREPKQQS